MMKFEYEISLDRWMREKWHLPESDLEFWAGVNGYSPYDPPSRYEYGKPLEPEHQASINELRIFCGAQEITDLLSDGDFQEVDEYVIEKIAGE